MMVKQKMFKRLFYFLCLLLLLASCKTSRQVTAESTANAASSQKYLESVLLNAPSFNTFSSKVRLNVDLDGKNMVVSGSLKMKKNDAIQISIAPILGIEVARIEITPEYILAIDRMNKRYVQAPVSLLKSMGNTDLDFYALQALFYNELFLPGMQTVTTKELTLFDLTKELAGETIIRPRKNSGINLSFRTNTADARLMGCRITSGTNYLFEWLYAGFEPFKGKSFPSIMEIKLQDPNRKASVILEFSKMNEGKNENIRTEIPKKYKQVEIDLLIKQLMNI